MTNKRHEASYTQRVDFVKEIDANNQVSYLLYDIVSIPADKFELDKKVYMLIDDEVFTLNTTYEVAENSRNIKHEKSDILLSDSTKTTVVTGFGMDSRRIIKMKHELEQEQIDKMLQAKEIHLRYYSGPNTINSEIEGLRLNRVKKWILK